LFRGEVTVVQCTIINNTIITKNEKKNEKNETAFSARPQKNEIKKNVFAFRFKNVFKTKKKRNGLFELGKKTKRKRNGTPRPKGKNETKKRFRNEIRYVNYFFLLGNSNKITIIIANFEINYYQL